MYGPHEPTESQINDWNIHNDHFDDALYYYGQEQDNEYDNEVEAGLVNADLARQDEEADHERDYY